MPVLYFDMDGVLAIFDEQDAVTKPFMTPNSHYFRYCQPDSTAVRLMRKFHEKPGVKVNILTRILNVQNMIHEWSEDKAIWAANNCMAMYDKIIITAKPNKTSILARIPEQERRQHVLIDDDPMILDTWQVVGGTSIQYLQPQRIVPTWDGITIKYTDPYDKSVETIDALLHTLTTN